MSDRTRFFQTMLLAAGVGALVGAGLSVLALNQPLNYRGHALNALVMAALFLPLGAILGSVSQKMRESHMQLNLGSLFVATFWIGLACATIPIWLNGSWPDKRQLIWPGLAYSCILASLSSLTGRYSIGLAIGASGALCVLVVSWLVNR